jgi:hypothetical protein
MVAAGRWRVPIMSTPDIANLVRNIKARTTLWTGDVEARLRTRFSNYRAAQRTASSARPDGGLQELLAAARTRYAAAEFDVSALMPDLLLRDVLSSELHQIYDRIVDVERQAHLRSSSKSAAILRTVLRDLDRVRRISQSSGHAAGPEPSDSTGIPQSVSEAYRVLGMNSEATTAVAKKLVDALRMSWHPDHARDEADRLRREGRMKQINAAWDLIKDRRAAA